MDGEERSRWLEAIPKRYSERKFNNLPISSGDELSVNINPEPVCALLVSIAKYFNALPELSSSSEVTSKKYFCPLKSASDIIFAIESESTLIR